VGTLGETKEGVMTLPMRLQVVPGDAEARARIAGATRAFRIDALAPDRREAALAAERYLINQSARGAAQEEWLHEQRVASACPRHVALKRLLG
jgi:hypothetical protein